MKAITFPQLCERCVYNYQRERRNALGEIEAECLYGEDGSKPGPLVSSEHCPRWAELPDCDSGHWTREPPTKPGWYRCKIKGLLVYELRRFSLNIHKELKMDIFNPTTGLWMNMVELKVARTVFSHFWSEPERLPAPPKEEP
jgi:hypothetical protein